MRRFVILTCLCVVLVLVVTFGLDGIAAKNAVEHHEFLMETILPGATEFTREYYDGEDGTILSVHSAPEGYVVETSTYGYAGQITMLVGVNKDGKVTGLVVKEAHETWGLGNQILTDHEFLAQFLNSAGSFAVATHGAEDAFSGATGEAEASDGSEVEVDAIAGATVSSKAVVRCVNSAVAYVTGADTSTGATSWGG